MAALEWRWWVFWTCGLALATAPTIFCCHTTEIVRQDEAVAQADRYMVIDGAVEIKGAAGDCAVGPQTPTTSTVSTGSEMPSITTHNWGKDGFAVLPRSDGSGIFLVPNKLQGTCECGGFGSSGNNTDVPWTVEIRNATGQPCGGVIITRRAVLTTEECLKGLYATDADIAGIKIHYELSNGTEDIKKVDQRAGPAVFTGSGFGFIMVDSEIANNPICLPPIPLDEKDTSTGVHHTSFLDCQDSTSNDSYPFRKADVTSHKLHCSPRQSNDTTADHSYIIYNREQDVNNDGEMIMTVGGHNCITHYVNAMCVSRDYVKPPLPMPDTGGEDKPFKALTGSAIYRKATLTVESYPDDIFLLNVLTGLVMKKDSPADYLFMNETISLRIETAVESIIGALKYVGGPCN